MCNRRCEYIIYIRLTGNKKETTRQKRGKGLSKGRGYASTYRKKRKTKRDIIK